MCSFKTTNVITVSSNSDRVMKTETANANVLSQFVHFYVRIKALIETHSLNSSVYFLKKDTLSRLIRYNKDTCT